MRTSHGTHVAVPLARLGMVKHSSARGRRSLQGLGESCSLPLCSFRPRPFCSHPERPDVPETELRSTKPGPRGPVFFTANCPTAPLADLFAANRHSLRSAQST